MRRTKIICTIGPATESETHLRELIRGGMNLARLNFSHGRHAWHRQAIQRIRKVSRETGVVVGIIADLCGPKLRVGKIASSSLLLKRGKEITLTGAPVEGNESIISVGSPEAIALLHPGGRVLLDDGKLELKVLSAGRGKAVCKVVRGGEIIQGKGVNFPSLTSAHLGLTPKDRDDLAFALRAGVDWVALSFVRSAHDLHFLREAIAKAGKQVPIIAKIEKPQAIEHLEEIICAADAIMVARGDLGVEMALEQVPLLQKQIIEKCSIAGKPVIVATQMLESMLHAARPTRAEVSDIANAILDGTDAVMLSGETAVGEYPLAALEVMSKVAKQTEKTLDYDKLLAERVERRCNTVTDAISQACAEIAQDLAVSAIVTSTASGHTAAMVSRLRPQAPLLAITPRETTCRRLTLWWGVRPFLVNKTKSTDEMVGIAQWAARKSGFSHPGDRIVVTAGIPPGLSGQTNLIKVETVK
jgi:pyruvate kinase